MGDGCRLFVFGVGEYVSREEMEQEFGRCGAVTDAYNTGKGYAFITMSSPSEAQAAVSQMHGAEVFGQTLKVNVAKPKEGGGGRGGGRYGGGRGDDSSASMGDGCRLFVYGVGENVSREEMEEEFGRCGAVTDAFNTGKGYAFITMSSPSEAQAVVSQMHGAEVFGQTLKVDVAKPKEGGGGGYGGGRDGGGGGGRY